MKIAVGMSGGVDSSTTALLLQRQGHEVVGVTMSLGREGEDLVVAETQAVADRLGIPLHIFDFSAEWRKNVLDYIRDTYIDGRTPNPCIRCNEMVKFGMLPQKAFEIGCDRFATGHYARLEDGPILKRGVDRGKDQSYFLYRVSPMILARTMFPLGGMSKPEVRALADGFGLAVASKGDSQDFCGGDPMEIVAAGEREGNIVTVDGKVLGKHKGYWNYTIGKRKGLGIGGGTPYYVIGLNAARNEVVVGFKESSISREFRVSQVVRLQEDWSGQLMVKVRSAGEPKGPVTVVEDGEGVRVECPEGMTGIAPGQSAVFYRGEVVLGGGILL